MGGGRRCGGGGRRKGGLASRALPALLAALPFLLLLLLLPGSSSATPSAALEPTATQGEVPVSAVTKVLPADEAPLPPATRAGPSAAEHLSAEAARGGLAVRVRRDTEVMGKQEFERTRPERAEWEARGLWTPSGMRPNRGTDVERVLRFAREGSVVVAQAGRGGTRVGVFDAPTGRPIDLGHGNGHVCAEGAALRGINVAIDHVARQPAGVRRAETAVAVMSALVAECKRNVLKAAVAGRFGVLAPGKADKRLTAVDLVRTWMYNVRLFVDATDGVRAVADRWAAGRGPRDSGDRSLERDLWPYLVAADHTVRETRGNLFLRAVPGRWEAYTGFVDAVERFGGMPEATGTTLYLGIGSSNAQVAAAVGPSLAEDGESDAELAAERAIARERKAPLAASHGQEAAGDAPPPSSAAALLETGARRGPMSLAYPRGGPARNPGEVFAKSLFGAGLDALLVRVLEIAYEDARNVTRPGEAVNAPCLAAGVVVRRASIESPAEEAGTTVCWGSAPGRGARRFRPTACGLMSSSRALVTAVVRGRVSFEGTSNHTECLAHVSRALDGPDTHLFPVPFPRQFREMLEPRGYGLGGGALSKKRRLALRRAVVGSVAGEAALREVSRVVVPGLTTPEPARDALTKLNADPNAPPEAKVILKMKLAKRARAEAMDKEARAKLEAEVVARSGDFVAKGLTMEQLRVFSRTMFGPRFGRRPLKDMDGETATLPLFGAVTEELLLRRLGMGAIGWAAGRVHLVGVDSLSGAAQVYAGAMTDRRARAALMARQYVSGTSSSEDPEDAPVVDKLESR